MGLDVEMSRKTFCINAAKAVVGVLAAGATGTAVGLITPGRRAVRKEGFELYPGWIEANTEARFIDPKNGGHFPFLRGAITNNPRLSELTRGYYAYLSGNLAGEQRINLGDALNFAIISADKRLKDIDPAKIKPRTNPLLESLHAGLFVFAAGFMPWFNTADLKKIGVDLRGYRNSESFFSAFETNIYPRLFTREDLKEDPTKFESGPDRTVHLAQHLLLAFEYLYSKHFNLGIEKSVPFGLQIYTFLMSLGNSTVAEAKAFSQGAGLGWEYYSLRNISNWPIFGRKIDDIREGPFDKMVEADYKANRLGALTGVDLFNLGITGEPFEKITSFTKGLNNPRFLRFETKPEL